MTLNLQLTIAALSQPVLLYHPSRRMIQLWRWKRMFAKCANIIALDLLQFSLFTNGQDSSSYLSCEAAE